MASFISDSDSDYGYDLTVSDEEFLLAIADRLAPVSPQAKSRPPAPVTPTHARNTNANANAVLFSSPVPFSPELDPDASLAIDETIAAISDDDLSSDFSEIEQNASPSHGQRRGHDDVARRGAVETTNIKRLTPTVPRYKEHVSSFVSKSKPRSVPTLLPGPDVSYPDCTLLPASPSRSPQVASN